MKTTRRFDRASSDDARFIVKQLLPDPKTRRFALQILLDSLELSNETDSASWGTTLLPNRLRLNVNRGETLALSEGAVEFLALGQPNETSARVEAAARRSLPEALRVRIEDFDLEREWAAWKPHFEAALVRGAGDFAGQNFKRPLWREAHSPGITGLLREEFGRAPAPSYFVEDEPTEAEHAPETLELTNQSSGNAPDELQAPPKSRQSKASASALEVLKSGVARAGLQLSEAHLASFFTALQTKGFVVLSGPSGTGKSRLALELAALLPRAHSNNGRTFTPPKSGLPMGRLVLPPALAREIEALSRPFRVGEKREITLDCDGAALHATLGREGAGLVVRVQGAARACLRLAFDAGHDLEGEVELDEARLVLRLLPVSPNKSEANHLFLSVRADWRDSSALLGHFNPILNRFEWTPLLRFLLRAQSAWKAGSRESFFVILDEMNLGRTEAYFADFLSVLESGRDASGQTREPLRLGFDSSATGELPPAELFLPPNLFFVGTLNDDETAHPLAPKVLDRAWPLESPPVDFAAYQPQLQGEPEHSDGQILADLLYREGKFGGYDKSLVAQELAREPRWRLDLTQLNEALSEWERGFGFRAFDEIVAFVALSRGNGMFDCAPVAFDCAVAAKIAPRLRGSGASVEGALAALESWADERGLSRTQGAARRRRRHLEREGWI